jgi:hypothetical protein
MAKQLHKRFSDEQVKMLLEKYANEKVELRYILETLRIRRRRFFQLLREYRKDPDNFSIQYKRRRATKTISEDVEENIISELEKEKRLIEDKSIPITFYNYSYIKDQIYQAYGQKVSLPTIISRARKQGFYRPRKKKNRSHDREVLTNYVGELIQHDSSHHKFSPYADKKWYLITSLDDYSRLFLFAKLIEKETSWQHILALQDVFLVWGFPFSYYVDSHSIFRFVQGRDSLWRKHYLVTDEADTQWKMVIDECRVKPIYALSPQARGKIERPYRWLQDRIVRTCAREGIEAIQQGREVLENEIERYNYRQVHSTTGEVPIIRFERAMREKKSLFREFTIPSPYTSVKDIFCLKVKRTVDAYHKISLDKLTFKVHKAPLRKEVQLRITLAENTGLAEIRIWYKDILTDVYQVKNSDLNSVHF